MSIVPPGATLVQTWDRKSPPAIDPEEDLDLGHVSDKRRDDFAAGRSCAHAALERIGIGTVSILRGPHREPLWPGGVVGSITHCDGYAAAAVGPSSVLHGIGIDAEPIRPLSESIVSMIATNYEIKRATALNPALPWALLLFSAKESVFKAWFPITKTWIGFEDVTIQFDHATGRFQAEINRATEPETVMTRQISGRFRHTDSHVFTCAAITRS